MTEPRSARWEFESTRLAGEAALRQLERWLAECGVTRPVANLCQLGLEEAIANAIRHGNRDDPARRVRILARCEPDRLVFRVADEGEGFDVEAISRYVRAVGEPEGAQAMRGQYGRWGGFGGLGLLLMTRSFDEVEFEEGGRAVRLTKRWLGPRGPEIPPVA